MCWCDGREQGASILHGCFKYTIESEVAKAFKPSSASQLQRFSGSRTPQTSEAPNSPERAQNAWGDRFAVLSKFEPQAASCMLNSGPDGGRMRRQKKQSVSGNFSPVAPHRQKRSTSCTGTKYVQIILRLPNEVWRCKQTSHGAVKKLFPPRRQ